MPPDPDHLAAIDDTSCVLSIVVLLSRTTVAKVAAIRFSGPEADVGARRTAIILVAGSGSALALEVHAGTAQKADWDNLRHISNCL